MTKPKVFDFVKSLKITLLIPAVLIVATIITAIVVGVDLDINFKGGTMLTYAYNGEIDTNQIESIVSKYHNGSISVTTGSSFLTASNTFTISFASNQGIGDEKQREITNAITSALPDNNIVLDDSKDVSPTTGTEFLLKCLVAVTLSFILLVIYIGYRFRKIGGISAGVFAIIALMHDVFLVFATFVFFRIAIDANFIAVALTILGYSINNTIVIYDRIRENRATTKMELTELVNTSITQTLGRSINTTVATLIAAVCILIVALVTGVNSIFSFAFPLIVGLIGGAYSSIFLAGPLWVIWQRKKGSMKSEPGIKQKKVTESE